MPGLGGPGDGSRPVRPAPGARGQAGSPTWRPGRRGACVHPRPWPRCRSAGPGVGQASSHLWAPACAPPLGTRPAWRTSTRGSSNASPRLTPCCCGWPGRPPWACPATAAHVAPPCAAPAQWSSPPPVSPTAHHQEFPSGHAASAAAFATAVTLESPWLGAALVPIAAGVAASRAHTDGHSPGEVLAGVAVGVGIAATTCRW